MNEQVFVFKVKNKDNSRPYLYAVPSSKIEMIESRYGSQNVYLVINGVEVEGSFDEFLKLFGDRVDYE